jgi:hypothetical protein
LSKAPEQPAIDYPDSDAGLDQAMAAWRRGPAGSDTYRQVISFQVPGGAPGGLEQIDAEYRFGRGELGETVDVSLDGHNLSLDAPIRLKPVSISKPWGRELWYTGMEERGESRVLTADGSLPLSSYLALAPGRLCRRCPVVLLKILDPAATPVAGDLYFEVHEHKREVYVVTHVSQSAWPDGTGAMRLGMSQARRAEFTDDSEFRHAYLAAVKAYEAVRRRMDRGERLAPATEARLRETMEGFTALAPLRVGDVVTVHPWLPHSLQHGVRVVEFQTPTYERYILSFGQRVLTQNHWDTEAVLDRIDLEPPRADTFEQIAPGIRQIADFDDFSAFRVEIASGASCPLGVDLPYAVCMGVAGSVSLNGLALGAEEACFVPASALPVTFANRAATPAVVLVAAAKR